MDRTYAPDFLIRIGGLTLAGDVSRAVIGLTYDNSLETADMFTLRLSNAGLRLTDSALLDIGNEVEVWIGYVGALRPVMLGEIAAVSPSFPQSGAPTLTVSGYDKSHRLRHNAPDRFTFKFMNDSAIAAQIAIENGLVPAVDPVPTGPRESVQQTGSDWALLTELAERNGFRVRVEWDRLHFGLPRPQTELVALEWGRDLISFEPRLSTAAQAGLQVIRGYDDRLAQAIVAVLPAVALGDDLGAVVERLGSDFLDGLVNLGRSVVRDRPVDTFFDAAVLAKSMLTRLLEGLYEGSGACVGAPALRAGDLVEIRGVGKRFGGTYRLSRVTHTIDEGGYQTRFEVTQGSAGTLLGSLRETVAEAPSPKRREKVFGVVVGRVENNVDPDGLGRVQLSLPLVSDVNLSAWARIATPMAGGGYGVYLLPEIGQEVLVAFEQGEVDRPVVLGGLWSEPARPPETNPGANPRKLVKTRAGQVVFDETPGKETVTLQSVGDVVIEAGRNVTIKSGPAGVIDLNP